MCKDEKCKVCALPKEIQQKVVNLRFGEIVSAYEATKK